jgi:hypothetical protein
MKLPNWEEEIKLYQIMNAGHIADVKSAIVYI